MLQAELIQNVQSPMYDLSNWNSGYNQAIIFKDQCIAVLHCDFKSMRPAHPSVTVHVWFSVPWVEMNKFTYLHHSIHFSAMKDTFYVKGVWKIELWRKKFQSVQLMCGWVKYILKANYNTYLWKLSIMVNNQFPFLLFPKI